MYSIIQKKKKRRIIPLIPGDTIMVSTIWNTLYQSLGTIDINLLGHYVSIS